jgi:N-methylhydantoinase B
MTFKSDGVLIEVLRNRFQAIVEEMASIALQAGHTVFVKETGDFGAALVSLNGEVFAASRRIGVVALIGMPVGDVIRQSRELNEEPGDVFIANDPHATRGMSTHLPDLFVWKPIFHEGRPICYAFSFVHCTDIGGRVPGSILPSNHEIYQEGLRIPPSRLLRRGQVNQEFLNLFMLNVRIPDQNWGDLKALIAGLNTAEQRVHDLIGRYDAQSLSDGISRVLDYAEAEAREIISRVPDGTYTFWDYTEGDHAGGGMVRVKLHLRVEGSDLHFDFHETDPQVRFAINLPTYSIRGHWMVAFGVIYWLRSVMREITYNAGLGRPIHLYVPEGNLLNPDATAAVGVRSVTMLRGVDAFCGALAQALPDAIPAAGGGQSSILLVSVPNPDTGKMKVSVVQPLCGGSGARPQADGIDGVDLLMGYLRNIPTEVIEAEMPGVLIHRYALRPGSGGPGRWRGGVGVVLELQVFQPHATITSRGMDRYLFRPWGRLGGHAGTPGRTLLNPETPGQRDIGKVDILHLEPGDVLRILTQGGGGFGDPLDRDPERVRSDVENDLVTPDEAADTYGVVLSGGGIDVDATAARRGGLRQGRAAASPFAFGPERLAYEERWPDALQSALNGALAGYPTALRTFLRERAVRYIDDRARAGERTQPEQAERIVSEVLTELRTMGVRRPQAPAAPKSPA